MDDGLTDAGDEAAWMIHLIRERATEEQVRELLEALQTYIKLAVDVQQRILAGGGTLHADCEAALLEAGSQQADIWGADWFPASQEVRFESLINIRPKQGNRSLLIGDPALREMVEAIARERLSG